jgi:S-DNA-T family DNA segregation ATPase FtsK/SpoIIIE
MILINSGDPLPDLVIVIICRWIWRYRSELAPPAIAALTALAALALHEIHPNWWPELGVATGVGMVGTWIAGSRGERLTRNEQVYAGTIVVSVGGWLAAATVIGPRNAPLPAILLLGTCLLGIPWRAHRRRRAKVRVERTLAAWPDIAAAVGLSGSRVMSAAVDVWGWRARFGLARGQTITDVVAKLPAIESGLGTFRGAARVLPTPDDLANRFELRVLDKDPHADAISWPGPSVQSITESIDLGPFEDATPARVLMLRRHALFGGATGSGKSGGLNVLMGNLTACADVVIWAIDLKRGMELRPWAPCIDRLATTPAEARALLADGVAILEARAAFLAATGRRVWQPSPELPALMIIVDEYAELADTAPDASSDADSVARRGRAVAVTLIAATQRPTQKAMGQGALRSQMDVRICFRVRERKDVDLILGQGMLTAGWQAHTLNAPGKFLMSAPEHDIPRRARAYLLTDEAVSAAVRDNAPLRPVLDEISRRAAEERAQIRPDTPARTVTPEHRDDSRNAPDETRDAPEVILWAALSLAPAEGITVPELIDQTRMSRPWIYQRLQDLARRGQVQQISRGRWSATGDAP